MELDPVNIQGLHNLCVVFVERGKLLEAQTCLERAHNLAPGEDYVLRHLQIVKNRIAKLRINPNEIEENTNFNSSPGNRLISNNSNQNIDDTDRSTQPVVSQDSDNQRYSSHVVNTEPVFVKNVDDSESDEDIINSFVEEVSETKQIINKPIIKRKKVPPQKGGTDGDDPSSGMS